MGARKTLATCSSRVPGGQALNRFDSHAQQERSQIRDAERVRLNSDLGHSSVDPSHLKRSRSDINRIAVLGFELLPHGGFKKTYGGPGGGGVFFPPACHVLTL